MTSDLNPDIGAPLSQSRPGDKPVTDEDEDAAYDLDELADNKPRKKRKLIQNSDKKYLCPHGDCGKAYSRAEHLYRHQLNHTPKQIYRCDFPGCDRNFVRADLCARHKERHTAKGSHLQRKDAFLHSQNVMTSTSGSHSPSDVAPTIPSPEQSSQRLLLLPNQDDSTSVGANARTYPATIEQYNIHTMAEHQPARQSDAGLPLDPRLSAGSSYSGYPSIVNETSYPSSTLPPTSPPLSRRFGHDDAYPRLCSQESGFANPQTVTLNAMQPPPILSPLSAGHVFAHPPYLSPTMSSQNFRSPTTSSILPSLPPFGFPQGYTAPRNSRSSGILSPTHMNSIDQYSMPTSRTNSSADMSGIDRLTSGYAMPVFDNNAFGRSPPTVMDDSFLTSLFDVSDLKPIMQSPPGPESMHNAHIFNVPFPKLEPDVSPHEQSLPAGTWNSPPAAPAANGSDSDMRDSVISINKKNRLMRLFSSWNDNEQDPAHRIRAELLNGDSDDPNHVMSLKLLRTYMTSYWMHIHQQMPIFHRPTFNVETCPDLLVLAIICLGATCLERSHGYKLMQDSAELSAFVAYHIRWEVFRDVEFRPTAKLWTFQAMLLLELFEKMYSTKALHERAHIHHATTLSVMRRGSSLVARSATESLLNGEDPTRTPPGPDGSINTTGQNTPDAFWNRWITAEATRRIAFAAFIIDSTHATLFGHTAIMSPHELRLPLPCDETLWSATSSEEVQRLEASNAAKGIKTITFLDGLKRSLNGQKVRTNTFGRVILISGLLNVSWHMNQRDLQVLSLGASNMLGNQIRWRAPLTRAFDFWRRDFDESLAKSEHWLQVCDPKCNDRSSIHHRDNVFESRTCLHTLAHMAMHVDIIDCHIFAGSDLVLGRVVTDTDRAAVQTRMREHWAPSARARDATFYALRFLCEVLIPEEELSSKRPRPHEPPTFTYSARDDYLLNRPWVLFFALLIVWSYGYALDGPIRPSNYTLTTRELQIFDMQRYLIRMGGVASPDDLEKLKDRNSCLGLLLLLRESFKQPRWELLHDANDVLGSCVDLLLPGHSDLAGKHLHGV